jgi:DNA-directed RNA polymerase specialized sigma subunit, sigma24 homolog
MEEKELIYRLKNGDEDAFSRIYQAYWRKVYNFARLYITYADDIEEIVQEIFIKLWESRCFIDENQSFQGYLFIITRNAIFNDSRKHLNYSFLKLTALQSIDIAYEKMIILNCLI